MDSSELCYLKEWSIMGDLLKKLPTKIQKGLFSIDLNITSVDVVPEFIAIGTNGGLVFWYNRKSGNLQKLRCETTSEVTCVRIVSSVEFMVAVGCASGEISAFQIQKEHPPDLNLEPLTRPKPIQRYAIRSLHKTTIKCVEWSKNGMKLFSGDKNGVVVLTEFDYQLHQSKSMEILNEAYDIVQIAFQKPWLLVSTIYRAIICEKKSDGKWKVTQIGKKDRKLLSDFGIGFRGPPRTPSIISTRPGFRFWVADTDGNVSQTLLFKDALTKPSHEIPLLNPGRTPSRIPQNFEKIYLYKNDYIVTCCETVVYILNIDSLRIEACVRQLRGVLNIAICDSEIFIVEGIRSIVRISTSIDEYNHILVNTNANIIYNPHLQLNPMAPGTFEQPIIEIDEEAVINAEECFELPPIESLDIDLSIDLATRPHDYRLLKQDQLLLEHNRKVEAYDKINTTINYDEPILFKTGLLNRKHRHNREETKSKKKLITESVNGIVEIGRIALVTGDNDEQKVKAEEKEIVVEKKIDEPFLTTKPCVMEVSLCEPNECVVKEELIESPEKVDLSPIPKFPDKIDLSSSPKSPDAPEKINPIQSPSPVNLWKFPNTVLNDQQPKDSPLKKLYFINDDESPTSDDDKLKDNKMNNLSDDIKNIMIRSDQTGLSSKFYNPTNTTEPTSISYYDGGGPSNVDVTGVPGLTKMPEYMNIPNLWNVTIEQISLPDDDDDDDAADSDGALCGKAANKSSFGRKLTRNSSEPNSDNSSDWEIVDMDEKKYTLPLKYLSD